MISPIIYINSWPGVGKHTIAKETEKQMNGKARVVSPLLALINDPSFVNLPTKCLLSQVHNHLHIDLAGAILPRSSSDYLQLRRQLRSTLFNALATCPDTFRHT